MSHGDPSQPRSPQSGDAPLPDYGNGAHPGGNPWQAVPQPGEEQPYGQEPDYGEPSQYGPPAPYGPSSANQAPYGQPPYEQGQWYAPGQPQGQPYGQQPYGPPPANQPASGQPPFAAQHQQQFGYTPPQPPQQGMSTGGKVAIGCGIAFIVALVLTFAGCAALINAGPDTSDSSVSQGVGPTPGPDPSSDPAAPPAASPAATAPPSAAPRPAPAADPVPQVEELAEGVVAVGESLTLGEFEVEVSNVATGVSALDEPYSEGPNGEYIVVAVSITNTGSTQQTVDAEEFMLIDDVGNLHSESSSYYLDDGISYQDINPGVTVEGRVLFDVPVGTAVDYVAYEPRWGNDYVLVTVD